jgi:hypothetical protein
LFSVFCLFVCLLVFFCISVEDHIPSSYLFYIVLFYLYDIHMFYISLLLIYSIKCGKPFIK